MEITEKWLIDNGFNSKDIIVDLFGEFRPYNYSYSREFTNKLGNQIIVSYKLDTNWFVVSHKENNLCYVSLTIKTVVDFVCLLNLIGVSL